MYKRKRTSYQRRFARRANGYRRYRPKRRMFTRGGGRRSYGRMMTRNPLTSDTFFVKLKFGEIRNITFGSVTSGSYVYRGNSIYDPNFSGAGGAVTGKTEWFNMYSDVVILGSKATAKVINGTTEMLQFCLYPQRTSTPVGVGDGDLREIPYGRTKTTGVYNSNAQNNPVTVSNYFSTSKAYCVSKQHVKDQAAFWHQTGTNPTYQWFWVLQGEVPALAGSGLNYTLDMTITYYCMFKTRTNIVV